MSIQAPNRRYTYQDYQTWPDGERWELIAGIPYAMSPGPSAEHQMIVGEIFRHFANYLVGKPCRVLMAPLDVRLSGEVKQNGGSDTVVQPDLLVVCDKAKIDKKGCLGPPDLIVEVISESSAGMDRKIKRDLYQKAGVREYWIVDPSGKTVEVYRCNDALNFSLPDVYMDMDRIPVGIFPDLILEVNDIFNRVI